MKHSLKDIFLNVNDFNAQGLKPYGYPVLLSTLGYQHLKDSDQGVGVILKKRYAWAIVSMKLTILNPLKTPLKLDGETWYAGRKGPYYRREYIISSQGDILIKGASYSVLMDVENRSVYRQKELPFKELEPTLEFVVTLAANTKDDFQSAPIGEGKITNSLIDSLGHMNHLRYVELIYDALSLKEIDEVMAYNTMELFFQKEMVLGDEFMIHKGFSGDFLIFFLYNISKQEKAFTLRLSKETL